MLRDAANYGLFDQHLITGSKSIEELAREEQRKLDKAERVIETQNRFVEELEAQEWQLAKIIEAKKAYFSQAWKEETLAYRDRERLPSHNVNIFAPEVDGIVGLERQNWRQLKLIPVERDDESFTDLHNMYLRHTAKINRDFYYDLESYKMSLICGRAHQELIWDFSDDPFGEQKSVNIPPEEVLIDHNITDSDSLSGDKTIHIHMQWLPIRTVVKNWKVKSEDWTLLDYSAPGNPENRNVVAVQGITDSYNYPSDRYKTYFWKQERNWIRVIRCWKRDHKTVYRLLDLNPELPKPDLAFVDDFDTQDEAEKQQFKMAMYGRDISSMQIMPVKVFYWSYHVISGRSELAWTPDVGRFCPWIDYFAITMDGKFAGVWNRVEDRQKQVNFIRSKASERVGRIGHTPTVWRQNSFAQNINVATALRDGNPILVKEDVWDRNNGQPPFKTVEDDSLKYLPAFLQWAEAEKQDAVNAVGQGSVQRGLNPPGVTAASALAILQQEGTKITSGYGHNFQFARASKAFLRLYMLLEQYKKTPDLIKFKLERIFGSALSKDSQSEDQKLVMQLMMNGGIELDRLVLSVRYAKYDMELTDEPNSMYEKMQINQELTRLMQSGLQVPPEVWIDTSLLPPMMKDRLKEGVAQQPARVEDMMATPAGQTQLAMESGSGGQAMDGNFLAAQQASPNSLFSASQQ